MKISDILRHKPEHQGTDVITIEPGDTVESLIAMLAQMRVGALVVVDGSTADAAVVGIVSERDIVRRLNDLGAAILDATVDQIMTAEVFSCSPTDDVDDIAAVMTERRIRHMPVLDAGRLAGLVSIGDVVSSRIRQLEQDRGQLEHYITG